MAKKTDEEWDRHLRELDAFSKEYDRKRLEEDSKRTKFIKECLRKRMTYREIGEILGVSKQRVYALLRYKNGTIVPYSIRRMVLERDKNKCRICGRNAEQAGFKRLHIHHIRRAKDGSLRNLVLLCPRCHKRVEGMKNNGSKTKKY